MALSKYAQSEDHTNYEALAIGISNDFVSRFRAFLQAAAVWDYSRPVLQHAFIRPLDDDGQIVDVTAATQIEISATDSYRLHIMTLKADGGLRESEKHGGIKYRLFKTGGYNEGFWVAPDQAKHLADKEGVIHIPALTTGVIPSGATYKHPLRYEVEDPGIGKQGKYGTYDEPRVLVGHGPKSKTWDTVLGRAPSYDHFMPNLDEIPWAEFYADSILNLKRMIKAVEADANATDTKTLYMAFDMANTDPETTHRRQRRGAKKLLDAIVHWKIDATYHQVSGSIGLKTEGKARIPDVAFNPRYLYEAIDFLTDGSERVEIQMHAREIEGIGKPAVFIPSWEGIRNYRVILMTIRL